MYLTDALRPHCFPFFVKHFAQCKYLHDIELIVLTHDSEPAYYEQFLKQTPISYKLAIVPHDRNYLRKVFATIDYAKNNGIPYIMKHDNDILMSNHLYDYLYENLDTLQDKQNIVLTPTLTSGIPTCEMFLQDYCTQEERDEINTLFLQYEHGPLWGTDYTELNEFTRNATKWDAESYFQAVKRRTHAYKGIHPLRMREDAIRKLNEYVVKYKERILSKENYSLILDNKTPYFCNSVFCIRTDTYNTLLQHQELYVDNYDEVPFNKWRDMYSLNLVIVKNGTAIHPYYNTIDNYISYEKLLLDKLYR
jgi:hypothetical protein